MNCTEKVIRELTVQQWGIKVMEYSQLIARLPKAELHLHIEGSLEPELMFRLAQRNGVSIPFESVQEVRDAYKFSNLQEFLDIYFQGSEVLLVEQDFYDLTWEYIEQCRKNNIVHCEIFFDPQAHTDRGVDFGAVVTGISRALQDAQDKHSISSRLIMSFLRHLDEKSAFATLDAARPYLALIHGVGLDSSEQGHPPEKFQRVFAAAHALGLKKVAHAGEEGPPEYVWEALQLLQVARIDHGNRALEDPELVQYLKQTGIPLTVCPLSNLCLRVVDRLENHPLKTMLDAGLVATINSDDPAYFGGYLNENYLQVSKALQLDESELLVLVKNSFKASFLSSGEIALKLAEVERCLNRK